MFLSYQHPTPYTPQEDGSYVNCTTLANDPRAMRKGEVIAAETAAHLLLGENNNGDRLILHAEDLHASEHRTHRDDDDDTSESQGNIIGTPMVERAERFTWDANGWRVDECSTTETTSSPRSPTLQPEGPNENLGHWSGGHASGGAQPADEQRRLPAAAQQTISTQSTTRVPATTTTKSTAPTTTTTTATTTTTTTTATTPATTPKSTTTRSPEEERNHKRQLDRGAVSEQKLILEAMEPCKTRSGRFYIANCVTKHVGQPRKPRLRAWERQRSPNATAAPSRN